MASLGSACRGARSAWKQGLAFAAALLSTAASHAQPTVDSPLVARGAGDGLKAPLILDAARLDTLRRHDHVIVPDFPLPDGRALTLRLERFEALAPDARVVEGTPGGDKPLPRPDVLLLRGEVIGAADSQVFLALSPSGTNGFLRLPEATYLVAAGTQDGREPIMISNATAMPPLAGGAPRSCLGGLPVPGLVRPSMLTPVQISAPEALPCREVKMAVDTDYEYFTISRFGGNPMAASNYIVTLFGAISEIYRRDVNTTFLLTFTRIWTTNTDPYVGAGIGDRLGEFRDHWVGSMSSVQRNLAHLLSGVPDGGVAWVGVVCNSSWGYGASASISGYFPYPLVDYNWQNWDLMVVGHEAGHNFNAPHTHDMVPQIDGCGTGNCGDAGLGTIMSYCHTCAGGMNNIKLSLHQRIVDERIVPHLNGLSCGLVRGPISVIVQPASRTVFAGETVFFTVIDVGATTYRWQRNGVNLVNGGNISGALTRTLTIANARWADEAGYRVQMNNACYSDVSATATLTVICRVDYNADRELDFGDIEGFLASYNAGTLGSTAPGADLNADGELDFTDIEALLALLAAGC